MIPDTKNSSAPKSWASITAVSWNQQIQKYAIEHCIKLFSYDLNMHHMWTLAWKVATMHMPKQEIIPNTRAALLSLGPITCVSSVSFSTYLYLAYIVAVPVGKKWLRLSLVKFSLSVTTNKLSFHFSQKGKCDLYLRILFFYGKTLSCLTKSL